MLFSSMIFLWAFLPITLGLYYGVHILPISDTDLKMKIKNGILLVASLFFYGFGSVKYLLLMIGAIVVDYVGGYFVAEEGGFLSHEGYNAKSNKTFRSLCLILTLTINLSILFIFKYLGMFADVNIVLPIGISFYTFQAISYVADVYRGRVKVQKNPLTFALYVSLFPQLIAGPIVQYKDVEEQMHGRIETEEGFVYGIKRFCYGLGKKVLLANTFAVVADQIWDMNVAQLGAPLAWLGMIAYTLQIYYDFSGYSDMAIGLGHMFGFSFKENFNYPYTATSIQDFWRRWHMSLSGFFRDYVYIPLGGSREGMARTYRNILIVFALTGIWHGANYTFWLWGAIYGVLLVFERAFFGKTLQKNPVKILNWIYTIFIVMVEWVIFRSDSVGQALTYIGQLFTPGKAYTILSCLNARVWIALPIAILCSGWLQKLFGKMYGEHKENILIRIFDGAIQLTLLVLCIFSIAGGTYNPFIYFQF